MNNKIKKCMYSIIVIIIMFGLSGCKMKNDEKVSLEEKANTEISYIDSELIGIMNSLNNIDYTKYKVVEKGTESTSNSNEGSGGSKKSSENGDSQESSGSSQESSGEEEKGSGSQNSSESDSESKSSNKSDKMYSMEASNILESQDLEVEWSQLKNEIEGLYTTWTTVSIDLKELNIPEEELNKFVEKLDETALAIKSENKEETMNKVYELYGFLPSFTEIYSNDDKTKNILKTKYSLLQCYKLADSEKWDELQNALTDLKMNFSNVSNKKNEYKGKSVNINNASIIIKEMNDSIKIKDRDIFLIKYKNLIQELNVILSN